MMLTISIQSFLMILNWCTTPKMIHKITCTVDYNYWLNVWTLNLMNQSIKFRTMIIIVKPTNENHSLRRWGTSVIKSPMSPPSMKYLPINFSLFNLELFHTWFLVFHFNLNILNNSSKFSCTIRALNYCPEG